MNCLTEASRARGKSDYEWQPGAADAGSTASAEPVWRLRPGGLKLLGNASTVLPGGGASSLSLAPPPAGGLEALLSCDQSSRFIHPDEVQMVGREVSAASGQKDGWLPLGGAASGGISVMRRAGESLSDAITVKVEATLPGLPLEVSCTQCNDFLVRSRWDQNVGDFQTHDDWGCPASHGNGLFYFNVSMPPLTDRDFLAFFVLATAADGNSYFTFIRDAQHPAYPPGHKGRVRSEMRGCVVMLCRDEKDPNSSRLVMITKQDVKLPIIPYWLINMVFPLELRKWAKGLRKAGADQLKTIGQNGLEQLTVAPLFRPEQQESRDSPEANDDKENEVLSANCSNSAPVVPLLELSKSLSGNPETGDVAQLNVLPKEQPSQIDAPFHTKPVLPLLKLPEEVSIAAESAKPSTWLCGMGACNNCQSL